MNQEERLVALETKIAYLEDFISELNIVVVSQEKNIRKLESETENLRNQLTTVKENLPEKEKPPHY